MCGFSAVASLTKDEMSGDIINQLSENYSEELIRRGPDQQNLIQYSGFILKHYSLLQYIVLYCKMLYLILY